MLSSLLYSDQVVIKDPISDWFSEEQYFNVHKMGARPGYYTRERDAEANVLQTRAFLTNVLPALAALRPLIELGAVVLAPSEFVIRRDNSDIEAIETALGNELLSDVAAYSRRFSPQDVAVEDNVRGMFVFTGGNQEQQLRDAIRLGLRHFAREYHLASAYGAIYTAPFTHEQFLVSEGLGRAIRPAARVTSALVTSQLPIFGGLTPAMLAKLHEDDAFAAFREDLHAIYSAAPVGEGEDVLQDYLTDQEHALLEPHLSAAKRSVDRGPLRHLGAVMRSAGFGMSMGLVTDVVAGTPLIATALGALTTGGEAWLENRRASGSAAIWATLVKHNRTAQAEIRGVMRQPSQNVQRNKLWGIPDQPSMNVTITEGSILADWLPRPRVETGSDNSDYSLGDYRPCDCGSGRKFRFCCRGLRVHRPGGQELR